MSKPNKVQCECKVCGKEFGVWPSNIVRGKGKYCSRACAGEGLSSHSTHECHTCGTVFNMPPSRRQHLTAHCSMKCYTHQHGRKAMEKRLEDQVHKREGVDGCWIWKGCRFPSGYGLIAMTTPQGRKQKQLAHRVAWSFHNGPIPDGMCVCHKCDTPLCINPDHLFLGTTAENTQDKVAKGRQSKGESHPLSKLREAQVTEIRRLRRDGKKLREIAAIFAIRPCTVANIINGRTWKHVH